MLHFTSVKAWSYTCICIYSQVMERKQHHTDNNMMVDGKKTTLHSHHKVGGKHSSLRKETAKRTLRCLIGCNIGEGIGAAIGFVLGMDMISTLILAIGLAFTVGYAFTMILCSELCH